MSTGIAVKRIPNNAGKYYFIASLAKNEICTPLLNDGSAIDIVWNETYLKVLLRKLLLQLSRSNGNVAKILNYYVS